MIDLSNSMMPEMTLVNTNVIAYMRHDGRTFCSVCLEDAWREILLQRDTEIRHCRVADAKCTRSTKVPCCVAGLF